MRQHVQCTDPSRIATAGEVDVVLFDKTGTITADTLLPAGVPLAAARGRRILTSF